MFAVFVTSGWVRYYVGFWCFFATCLLLYKDNIVRRFIKIVKFFGKLYWHVWMWPSFELSTHFSKSTALLLVTLIDVAYIIHYIQLFLTERCPSHNHRHLAGQIWWRRKNGLRWPKKICLYVPADAVRTGVKVVNLIRAGGQSVWIFHFFGILRAYY